MIMLTALMLTTVLTGCESADEKKLRLDRDFEIRKIEAANGTAAQREENRHERQMAYIQRPVMPIAPGNYIDYRGNATYGSWGLLGWTWYDTDSSYARESRRYVDYQISSGYYSDNYLDQPYSRQRFDNKHQDGWKQTTVVVNNYTSAKGGKPLTEKQFKTNTKKAEVKNTKWKKDKKVQSTYAKKGFHSNFKKNKAQSDAKKTPVKPKVPAKPLTAKQKQDQKNAKLKADLKAKQKAKKDKVARDKKAKADKIARDKAQKKAKAKRDAKEKAKREAAARKRAAQKKY